MPKICIQTAVEQSVTSVWQGFDEALFKALSPPFPRVKVLRFDGCNEGDRVEIQMNLVFFTQEWHALITAQASASNEIYFIDQGTTLPSFLQTWQHKHRIVQQQQQTYIIDEITYQSPYRWLDYVLYPALYLQFLYRKPIYKRFFRKK